MSRIANDALAKTAAIPHSEQRETVAAGDLRFSFELAARKGFDHTMRGIDFQRDEDGNYRWAVTRNLYEFWETACGIRASLAPVAAPVPEAKAEQAASRLPPLPDPEGEHDYTWGQMKRYALEAVLTDRVARQTAPAVKHEASELQHLENCIGGDKGPCNCELVRQMHSPLSPPDSVERVIDAIKAAPVRIAARADMTPKGNMSVEFPPIAAQGSIGDDDGFLSVLSDYAKTLTTCGVSDIQWSMDRLIAYIDSRSPVAADAVRVAALEQAAKVCDSIATGQEQYYRGGCLSCARSIRALSAAAPSADAKGPSHD